MFKILCLLRDLNSLRTVQWDIEGDQMVVRIPVDETDTKFVRDMQAMFS